METENIATAELTDRFEPMPPACLIYLEDVRYAPLLVILTVYILLLALGIHLTT